MRLKYGTLHKSHRKHTVRKVSVKFTVNLKLSSYTDTVEPRFNKPLFNEVLDKTNDIYVPAKVAVKCTEYIEPRYNGPRYNEYNPEAQT